VGYALAEPRLIEDWIEWDDGITNSIMTLFPCLNLQQSLNTIAIRQMVPRGPFQSELFWTFLGFTEYDKRKTRAGRLHLARRRCHRRVCAEGYPRRARADRNPRNGRARSARRRRLARPKPRCAGSGAPTAAS
jgi:hypothetical protein